MSMVDVGHIAAYRQTRTLIGWLGLRVGSRMALTYIRQMNWMNSRNDLCHDDSTINIVPGIIIIIIVIIIIIILNN